MIKYTVFAPGQRINSILDLATGSFTVREDVVAVPIEAVRSHYGSGALFVVLAEVNGTLQVGVFPKDEGGMRSFMGQPGFRPFYVILLPEGAGSYQDVGVSVIEIKHIGPLTSETTNVYQVLVGAGESCDATQAAQFLMCTGTPLNWLIFPDARFEIMEA